jgi:hypothetical protein
MNDRIRWLPNACYDHVFVVMREDGHGRGGSHVTLVKALWEEAAAEAEAARLNALHAGKGCRFEVQVCRVAPRRRVRVE